MREEGEKKGEGGGTKKRRLLNLQIGHLEMTAISAGMQRSRNMCPPAMRVHPPVPPHLQRRLMLLMGEHTSIHWDRGGHSSHVCVLVLHGSSRLFITHWAITSPS